MELFILLTLPRWLSGKESACQCKRCRRLEFDPWVRKIPWKRKWQSTPVFLPKKSHGQRSLVGYSPWGCKEWDTTDWACMHVHAIGTALENCNWMVAISCIVCMWVLREFPVWKRPPGVRESCVVSHSVTASMWLCSWTDGLLSSKFHKAICLHMLSIISLILNP